MDPLSDPSVLSARAALDAHKITGQALEKAYLSAVLRAFGGDRDRAFAALGLSRRTGYRRLAELGLSNPASPSR